jgi:AcrR family transcriptional regulator
MDEPQTGHLTPKALATRQRILDAALRLFAAKGYEGASMRDIAAGAGCSLGLAYRYFASKEDLVLELYRWLVSQLEELVSQLPVSTIAQRFDHLMRALFAVMTPHRLTLIALSGAALDPHSRAGVFGAEGAEVRRRAHVAYVGLVSGASDAPRSAQVDDLATILYGVQLALVLFWLQDLSGRAEKTEELLTFIVGTFQRFRPLLRLPATAHMLVRFATITGPLLGQNVG